MLLRPLSSHLPGQTLLERKLSARRRHSPTKKKKMMRMMMMMRMMNQSECQVHSQQ